MDTPCLYADKFEGLEKQAMCKCPVCLAHCSTTSAVTSYTETVRKDENAISIRYYSNIIVYMGYTSDSCRKGFSNTHRL